MCEILQREQQFRWSKSKNTMIVIFCVSHCSESPLCSHISFTDLHHWSAWPLWTVRAVKNWWLKLREQCGIGMGTLFSHKILCRAQMKLSQSEEWGVRIYFHFEIRGLFKSDYSPLQKRKHFKVVSVTSHWRPPFISYNKNGFKWSYKETRVSRRFFSTCTIYIFLLIYIFRALKAPKSGMWGFLAAAVIY